MGDPAQPGVQRRGLLQQDAGRTEAKGDAALPGPFGAARERFRTRPSCSSLGSDHTTFTYRYAGRDFRLTDVHGKVVSEVIAWTLRSLTAGRTGR